MVQHACGQKTFVLNKIGNNQMNNRNKRNSLHIHINSIIIQCENVKTKIIAGAFMNNLIGKTRNKACKPRSFLDAKINKFQSFSSDYFSICVVRPIARSVVLIIR